MAETFYRVHWADAPAFSPENAWSALWGSVRSNDGTQTECHDCAGTGREGAAEYGDPCTTCDGTGWEDALEGYSCCDTATDLVEYMRQHGVMADDDRVIIFEGRRVGTGFDGEPLAVPARIIEETTWSEFLARTG